MLEKRLAQMPSLFLNGQFTLFIQYHGIDATIGSLHRSLAAMDDCDSAHTFYNCISYEEHGLRSNQAITSRNGW
jgi:hypothetical protein